MKDEICGDREEMNSLKGMTCLMKKSETAPDSSRGVLNYKMRLYPFVFNVLIINVLYACCLSGCVEIYLSLFFSGY